MRIFTRLLGVAKYLGIGVLDVVYPRSCLMTGLPLDSGKFHFISEDGAKKLLIIDGDSACNRCGVPVLGDDSETPLCPECRDRDEEHQFGRSRSVLVLDDSSRPLVYSLKYWRHPAIVRDMAELAKMCHGFVKHLEGAILVPVPLYKKRLRKRGYNQSTHLAGEFVKIAAGTRAEELLVRVRDTGTQTQLDAESRRKNVKGAFAIKPGAVLDPFARYVLIDDVFTTGSTLSECAKALRAAGALNIDAATFAHG